MPRILVVATGEHLTVSAAPIHVAGMWECGDQRFYDPAGDQYQPAPDLPQAAPTDWLVDIGPFFDRFGATKMDVLTSASATVKAIVQDVMARKWIDLKRADVAQALDTIGAIVPSVTPELRREILTAPVKPEENLALRKLFFS